MQKGGYPAQLSWTGSILYRMAFEASGGSLYLWRGHPGCPKTQRQTCSVVSLRGRKTNMTRLEGGHIETRGWEMAGGDHRGSSQLSNAFGQEDMRPTMTLLSFHHNLDWYMKKWRLSPFWESSWYGLEKQAASYCLSVRQDLEPGALPNISLTI